MCNSRYFSIFGRLLTKMDKIGHFLSFDALGPKNCTKDAKGRLKTVAKNVKNYQFPSNSVHFRQKSSKDGKVPSVAHELSPLYYE